MTEAELLALIEEKDPADLTVEEVAALRAAVAASPAVAAAVRDRVALDECLFHGLGRPSLSVERILARARGGGARGGGRGRTFGLALAVALLLGAAALAWFVSRPERLVATRDDEPPAVEPVAEPMTEENAEPAKEPGGAEPNVADVAADPTEPTEEAEPDDDDRGLPPADDRMPWAIDPALVELAERAPDELLFAVPAASRQPPSQAELLRWLEPVADAPGGTPRGDLSVQKFVGLYRLRPPLAEGTALRITMHDLRRFRIHAWSGTSGAMLANFQWLNPPGNPWAAYLTTRKDAAPLPVHYVKLARDDDRAWRSWGLAPMAIDLRYEDGLLTLSHGDVRWMDVPLAARPTEIYIDLPLGRPHRLEMIPAVPLPPLPVVATERADVPLRASAGATWLGMPKAESGAALDKAADGRATLTAAENKEPAATLVRLPPASGPREVVVRIESADAGTGIILGNAEGQVLQAYTVRSAQHDKAQRLLWPTAVGDNGLEADAAFEKRIPEFIGEGTWLKVVECGGLIHGFTSPDGVHWAHMHVGAPAVPGTIASIGPYAVAHPSRRSITIGSVEVGSFPRLAAAAEPELLKELATRCPADRAVEILEATWRKSLAAGIEPEAALALLDELATVAPVWLHANNSARVAGWYADLGRSLEAKGDASPYMAIRWRQQVAPIRSGHWYGFFPDALAREEACGHLVARRWNDLNALGRRVVAFNFTGAPHAAPFYDWASKVRRTTRVDAWKHPLDVTLEKEAGRVVDDIQAALDEDDVRRGCEAIVAAGANGPLGLATDPRDPDLTASLPTLVATLLRDTPRLRETMRSEFASRATLRLRQAIDTGDSSLLEAVTLQYPGTPQAAEAHLRLGDRDLAAGRLTLARSHYRAAHDADPEAGAAHREAAVAIAAALDDAPVPAAPGGPAATAAVTIDAATLPAAGWHALADEIRASRQSTQPFNRFGVPTMAVDALPPPGTYEVVKRARMEGDVGAGPEQVPPTYGVSGGPPPEVVEWVARQIAVTPAGPRFIVSNRFQVAAHDAATGGVQWRTGLGGEVAGTHQWTGQPMRPVVTGSQVFVRRLTKTGAFLAALRLADGGLVWQTPPARAGWTVVSDPVLGDHVLHAITASPGISGSKLWLASFSTATGELLAEHELFTNPVNAVSAGELGGRCQLIPVEDSFVVVTAGCVGCIEPGGRVRWVRREPWIPPVVDGSWVRQAQEPPLVHAGALLVVQPAAPAVVAIDIASGQTRWKHTLDDVRRAVGLTQAGDRRLLVVQRREGLTALDAASGEPVWQAELPGMLDGCLASQAGGILAAVHEAVPGKPVRMPVLVWLDGAAGTEQRRTPLPALEGPLPRLGPMFLAGGKTWVFSGDNLTDPTRTICELIAQPAAP